MKLYEAIPYKNRSQPTYGNPQDGVNWKLPKNPHYKHYPELQDSIFAGLSRLGPEQRKQLEAKYGVRTSLDLHTLPLPKMFELDQELHALLNIPY